MNAIQLNSKFCLTPNQCYDVKTEVPIWLIIILAGSTIFLIKEIYNSITN